MNKSKKIEKSYDEVNKKYTDLLDYNNTTEKIEFSVN